MRLNNISGKTETNLKDEFHPSHVFLPYSTTIMRDKIDEHYEIIKEFRR